MPSGMVFSQSPEFIGIAVNNHEALVAALRNLLDNMTESEMHRLGSQVDDAREVLARVEGR